MKKIQGVSFRLLSDAAEAWEAFSPSPAASQNAIDILEPIGRGLFSDGVTPKQISQQLRALGGQDVTVNIHSPGGAAYDGLAIYEALKAHPGEVTVRVLGMAASAASVVAMAGDRIEIPKSAHVMIHNSRVWASMTQHGADELKAKLREVDDAMAEIYAERTGQSAGDLSAWMAEDRRFFGAEAVEMGFADALSSAPAKAHAEAQAEDQSAGAAKRLVERILQETGHSRAQARALVASLSGAREAAEAPGAQDAAGTPGAQDAAEIERKLRELAGKIRA